MHLFFFWQLHSFLQNNQMVILVPLQAIPTLNKQSVMLGWAWLCKVIAFYTKTHFMLRWINSTIACPVTKKSNFLKCQPPPIVDDLPILGPYLLLTIQIWALRTCLFIHRKQTKQKIGANDSGIGKLSRNYTKFCAYIQLSIICWWFARS